MLLETWSERKGGKLGASVFFKVIKMLQTPTSNGLLPSVPSHGERAAVVALILILNDEMERKMRSGLADLTHKLQMKEKGEEKLGMKDVNKIFGWAIHSVRKKKQNQSFQVKEAGGR